MGPWEGSYMEKKTEKDVLRYLENGMVILSAEYQDNKLNREWYGVCKSLIVRGYLTVNPGVPLPSSVGIPKVIAQPYYIFTPSGAEYAARTLRPLAYWLSKNWFPTAVIALNILALIVTSILR